MIVETSTRELSRQSANLLSEDDLRSFSGNGFVTMTSISPADELAEIRRTLADLVARRVGEKEGSLFDTMESSTSSDVRRSIQLT